MRRGEETHVDTLGLPQKKVRQALDVALLGLEEYANTIKIAGSTTSNVQVFKSLQKRATNLACF